MLPGPHCPHCTCNYASTVSTQWAKYLYSVQTGYLLKIPTYEHRPVASPHHLFPSLTLLHSFPPLSWAAITTSLQFLLWALSPPHPLALSFSLCMSVSLCVCVWCSSSVVFAWKIVCAPRSAHLKSASLAAGRRRGRGGSLRLWRSLVWLLGKLFWFSIRWPTTQLETRAQTK